LAELVLEVAAAPAPDVTVVVVWTVVDGVTVVPNVEKAAINQTQGFFNLGHIPQ
jgi:hypothetical protein